MTYRLSRRGVAAGAATALAIGTLTVFGTSVADAAPVVRDWADGKTSFNRTISNGTPGVGETITVTTKWRRTDNVTETINWATDVNPPCLTYVPGSAKINGNPVTPVVNPNRGGTPPSGTVAVSGLTLVNAPGTNNPSYSVDYTVGANCVLGTLQTGMDYGGDRGAGYYGFGGPNITATKGNPTTTLAPATGKIGQPTTLTATVATSPTGGGYAAGNPVEFYDGVTKIGQGNLDAAGKATLAWTPTVEGAHALTAKFLATATANQSVSAVQNVTVNPADVTTTTTVTGPADAIAGTDVTLGVQVSPIPTGGTVQFKNGATNMGSPVTLDAQGKGSLTTKFTTTGAQSITAVYAGSAQFLTSTSGAHTLTVTTPPDVDTSITVSGPATGTVGTDVTLTAHVTDGPAAGGGTVQFKDGDTDLGGALPVGADGNVSLTTPLAAGPHAITAVYSGVGEYQGSTSIVHTVEMSPANVNTTTTVTGDATGVVGSDVALTAHVSPAPTLGAKVQFKDGDTLIGGLVDLDAQGNASITAPLAAGNHAITAVFAGAGEYQTSTSVAHNVTVTPANVATTTTITGDTVAATNADITLGVQVSPAPAGGTVQFKNGTTDIGAPVTLGADGKGTLTTKFTTTGAQNITAVYSGAGEYQTSTGTHTVTVTPANVPTTTTITGDTTGVAGSNVALTAHVSPAPALGAKVQFKDGDTNLGGLVDLDAQGNASITAPLAAGNHAITAVFAGAGEYQTSTSVAHNVTVTPANVATTTTITGDTVAATNADITLGVQVSPAPAGGTVQFKNGTTDIGAPVTLGADGKGTLTTKFTTAGAQSITAVYSGAGEYQTSTGTHTVTVTPANVATTTTITGDTVAVTNADITLGVQVSPAPAGGTVQFKNGTTDIGAPVTLGADGKGTLTTKFTTAGAQSITAVYSGAGEYQTSTGTHTVTVTPANVATTTTVTGDTTGVVGSNVALHANVSPAPALGAKVQFKDGATLIGGLVDLDTQGNASITAPLAAGNHAITAVFAGAGEFQASTSVAHTVTVTPANTGNTTTVTAPATATTGVEVELVANVSSASAGDTVQFMNGTTKIGSPVAVVNGKATLKHIFTSAGTSNITAVHSDSTDHVISTSEIRTVTVTDTPGGNTGGSLGNIFGSLGNIFGS